MFTSNTGGYSLADVAAATGNNRNSGFGTDGGWWIWIFVILFAFCGWGNGFGGFGNGAATTSGYTDAAIQRGFDTSNIVSKLDGITNGLCDGFYAVNNALQSGFNANNVANLQGFNAIQQAINTASTADLQNTYAVQQAINNTNTAQMQNTFGLQQAINADTTANLVNTNALSTQLSNCCCETRESIADVKTQLASDTCDVKNAIQTSTRDITDTVNSSVRGLMDFLVNDKLATLTSENQSLRNQISQSNQNNYLAAMSEAQTAELIRRINPMPVPAFNVPAPYPYAGYGCAACNG